MGERTCFIQLPRYFIKLLTVTRLCLFPDKTDPEVLASKIKMDPGSPSTTLDNYQLSNLDSPYAKLLFLNGFTRRMDLTLHERESY